MVSTFECGVCAEEKPELRTTCVTISGDDKVCVQCFQESILPGFKASIEDPSTYPFQWGGEGLDFRNFQGYIPVHDWQALIAAYALKAEELEMPKAERQYCRNDGTFVGPRRGRDLCPPTSKECSSCNQLVCLQCGRSLPHEVCRNSSVEEAFKDQDQGRDWQRCPSCGALGARGAGCNAIVCFMCNNEYCFTCGKEATHDSDHWTSGKPCPRFGLAGTANAIYDGEGAYIEDAFIPNDEDFRLQGVVAAARARLRPVRDHLLETLRSDIGPKDPETRALYEDFAIVVQDMITHYGLLDFLERPHIDDDKFAQREIHISEFVLDRPGSKPLINSFNIWDLYAEIMTTYTDMDDLEFARAIIDEEAKRNFIREMTAEFAPLRRVKTE